MNEDQTANFRTGMSILTAYREADEDRRNELTAQMIEASFEERGIPGVVGAVFGLQAIASLAVDLLATATGKTAPDVLQSVGRAFEQFMREQEERR